MSNRAIRRTVLALAAFAAAWAAIVAITGGFVLTIGGTRISSRDEVRPLVLAFFVLLVYVIAWRRHWRDDLGRLAPANPARAVAAGAAIAMLVFGIASGTHIAGGPDASGYVSEAAHFARGELTMPTPAWAIDAPWANAAMTASPLGWRPTQETHVLAPTYPPGYPMLMALFSVAGGQDAMFYVVPLLGAALVWATYLLGERLGGPTAGAIAAVLLVCSPTFLVLQQQVMSDVPVAAFWTLALVCALSSAHPLVAGAATAMAVLIRPNLAPLVAVPLVLLAVKREGAVSRLLWFAIPVCLAAALIATLNWTYYGSPLSSGYGSLEHLYSRALVWPNLVQYARWFSDAHTSLVLLGVLAFAMHSGDRNARVRTALVSLVFPIAVLALYLPYMKFQSFEWWYTRFLLPGYPALLAGLGTVLVASVSRVQRPNIAIAAAAVIVVLIGAHGWTFVLARNQLRHKFADERFARAIGYVRRLPPRSLFVSLAHSGTIRFYTGRDIFRFEAVDPAQLDQAMAYVRRLGYRLYLVGDEFEIEMFRSRFAATRTVADIDPRRRVNLNGVSVYPLTATD